MLDIRESIIAVAYIVSAVLFIFGLKRLSSPATARSGNQLAAFGMVLALAYLSQWRRKGRWHDGSCCLH